MNIQKKFAILLFIMGIIGTIFFEYGMNELISHWEEKPTIISIPCYNYYNNVITGVTCEKKEYSESINDSANYITFGLFLLGQGFVFGILLWRLK